MILNWLKGQTGCVNHCKVKRRNYERKNLSVLRRTDHGGSGEVPELSGVSVGGSMRDNIMFIPAMILMIVEALALGFLIWSWFDAKRREKK